MMRTNPLGRRAQHQLPLDLLAIVLFVLIVVVFLFIFSTMQGAVQQTTRTDYGVAQTHMQLLQFMKSDAQGEPMAQFLDDSTTDDVAKATAAYFNARYGDGWDYKVHYSDGRGDIQNKGGHSYSPQVALAVLKSIPLYATGKGIPPVISEPVTVTQTIPARDGSTITFTLSTWVVF